MSDHPSPAAGVFAEEALPLAAPNPMFRQLLPGDRIPSLNRPCGERPRFAFDTLAGRYHLYGFFLAADHPGSPQVFEAVFRRRELFDDRHCSFTGVSIVERDRANPGLRNLEPGIRFAWDFDHAMAQACGATPLGSSPFGETAARRRWVLVDPSLHVLGVYPMNAIEPDAVLDMVERLPPPDRFGGVSRPAPVLMLPNVLEPGLCGRLVAAYQAGGGEDSGVHRDGAGVIDPGFKRRRDHVIGDAELLSELCWRIARRVLPEVERLFFMRARHIERHIVGCYAGSDGGHFAPHNNGPGLTAHRRFAVSINLNQGFEGGEVVFPEYNTEGYKAPAGWAIVFPCAILHAVRRVTSGVRYAYLPFIYDDAGQQIRARELARAQSLAAATSSPPAIGASAGGP